MTKFINVLKMIGLIALGLIVNIIPMLLLARQDDTPQYLWWILSLAYVLVVMAIIRLLWKKYKAYESLEVAQQRFGWKDFGVALLFFLAGRVVAIVGTQANFLFYGQQSSANDAALQATSISQVQHMFFLYFAIFHLALGLFAPILEELIYRGFLTNYFFNKEKKVLRAIISSSLFSLIHISNIVEFFMYFAIGLLFYLAYERRGNIKDSIAVHILNNFPLVLISIINYIIIISG